MSNAMTRPGWKRAMKELKALLRKYEPSTAPFEMIYDVEETNKKNGRRITKFHALRISVRKIKRRYEEYVG
jgi:hypothetical protein